LHKIDSHVAGIADGKKEFVERINEIKAHIAANAAEFNGKKTKLDDARKKKALIDVEIKSKEAEIKNKEGQTGAVKTNDAFKAMQNDIDNMRKDIRKFEDQQLVLMEEEDAAHAWIKSQEKAMKEKEALLLADIKKLESEAATKDGLISEEMNKRAEEVKNTDKAWYEKYEKIRKNKGLALAPILEGKNGSGACGGCKFDVRPQVIIELKKEGEIKTCSNCARIWYIEAKTEALK
jgi:predicted  nucleic acid-binding Zn-ribbon protein